MKVLIADDEPIAQNILERYLSQIDGIELIGKCENAREALAIINSRQVDLVLLDINMPGMTGIEMIEKLKNPPLVIFTTAYSEYAVKSYELNAVDYLVKPIPFERFINAIDKVKKILHTHAVKSAHTSAASKEEEQLLFVKSEGKLVKVDLSELWLVEGLRDYIRLWTDKSRIMVLTTMKNIEEQLSGDASFVRVNKSYIINMKYVTEIEGNTIRIRDQSVTIGNTYRQAIRQHLDKYKL